MINFKSLLETVYEPKSGDEKNFKDKHIVVKYKTPYDTESQFTSNLPKAASNRLKGVSRATDRLAK